jgi:hypothetical protein
VDLFFSIGALVIGLRVRYWTAAAIAALHLVAVVAMGVALKTGARQLALPAVALYLGAIVAAVVIYVQGWRLPREHARRETCELLGAIGLFGALAFTIGVIRTIVVVAGS